MNYNLNQVLEELGVHPTPEQLNQIKEAIEQDKEQEYELGMREAMFCGNCGALDSMDCCCEQEEESCSVCGSTCGESHHPKCIYGDPLDYVNCGYG